MQGFNIVGFRDAREVHLSVPGQELIAVAPELVDLGWGEVDAELQRPCDESLHSFYGLPDTADAGTVYRMPSRRAGSRGVGVH